MNYRQLAVQLVQMTPEAQRAYLARLTPAQLVAIHAATVALRQAAGLGGLGELGLDFGSLLRNIGGALLPFAGALPGVGPIVAAVGTAALNTFAPAPSQSLAIPPQSPPPAPAQPAGISPAVLLAGAALLVLVLRK